MRINLRFQVGQLSIHSCPLCLFPLRVDMQGKGKNSDNQKLKKELAENEKGKATMMAGTSNIIYSWKYVSGNEHNWHEGADNKTADHEYPKQQKLSSEIKFG